MKGATGFPVAASAVEVLFAIGTAVTVFGLWHTRWPGALAIKGSDLSTGYLFRYRASGYRNRPDRLRQHV